MEKNITGIDIVAGMAGTRPWWRLSAGDIEPWVRSLHFSAVEDHVSRTEWVGDAWDGNCYIEVGCRTIAAPDMNKLLDQLAQNIREFGHNRIAQPDARSVRQCFAGIGARQALAVDIDMGDFILPLCVEERNIDAGEGLAWTKVAAGMTFQIARVDEMRDRILARELRLRRAVEETVAGIGDGVAPLFLRMDPYPFDESPKHIPYSSYLMLIVALNDCLKWSPMGTERISTVKDVRDHRSWYAKTQRPRAAALAEMRARGSRGSICEVALAIIREQGLDPVNVFEQAREAALCDRRGAVNLVRKGSPLQLYYRDGMLRSSFHFDGGHYHTGSLTVWGSYPETYSIGAKGRPLAAYVDHPAFRAAGVTVSKAERREEALYLYHAVRAVRIEAIGAKPVNAGAISEEPFA